LASWSKTFTQRITTVNMLILKGLMRLNNMVSKGRPLDHTMIPTTSSPVDHPIEPLDNPPPNQRKLRKAAESCGKLGR
jgi:hypothetical protein